LPQIHDIDLLFSREKRLDCQKTGEVFLETLSSVVENGTRELGICLPPDTYALFEKYYALLEQKNEIVNLTSIKGAEDVARLHFLDSLALLGFADFKNARVIDVGSGAGFPGVPLKLAEPTIKLTLIDATGKRIAFLSELCSVIGIEAACVHARAEELALTPDMREQFDIAVSRAVARLNVLCELCLPFISVGGLFLAMKGTDSAEEIEEAQGASKRLGAEFADTFDYSIPGTEIRHRAIKIRKIAPTPTGYPRRFSKIQKSPISV